MSDHDDLYNKPRPYISDFEFDSNVASVFDDMITRSVPGYRALISQLGVFASFYYQPGTRCYDLGASLGAGTLSLVTALQERSPEIIAVDNAQAMLDRCRDRLGDYDNIQYVCADINDVAVENASLILMNFTLQFIDPDKRQQIINKLSAGLVPGGVLVLSEKVNVDTRDSGLAELHLEFKRCNGYSQLEISQKRSALENVLLPDTCERHIDRLRRAGFSRVEQWFQSFNFISLYAVK